MYIIQVFYPDREAPHHQERLVQARDVLDRISNLLVEHQDCGRVVVWLDHIRLFSVDCKGNRLPD